jgi:hypothetical protein
MNLRNIKTIKYDPVGDDIVDAINYATNDTWVTKQGDIILLSEMGTTHIINSLILVQKIYNDYLFKLSIYIKYSDIYRASDKDIARLKSLSNKQALKYNQLLQELDRRKDNHVN